MYGRGDRVVAQKLGEDLLEHHGLKGVRASSMAPGWQGRLTVKASGEAYDIDVDSSGAKWRGTTYADYRDLSDALAREIRGARGEGSTPIPKQKASSRDVDDSAADRRRVKSVDANADATIKEQTRELAVALKKSGIGADAHIRDGRSGKKGDLEVVIDGHRHEVHIEGATGHFTMYASDGASISTDKAAEVVAELKKSQEDSVLRKQLTKPGMSVLDVEAAVQAHKKNGKENAATLTPEDHQLLERTSRGLRESGLPLKTMNKLREMRAQGLVDFVPGRETIYKATAKGQEIIKANQEKQFARALYDGREPLNEGAKGEHEIKQSFHTTTLDRIGSILDKGLIPGHMKPSGQTFEATYHGKGNYLHGMMPQHEMDNGFDPDTGEAFLGSIEYKPFKIPASHVVPDEEAGDPEDTAQVIRDQGPVVVAKKLDPSMVKAVHLPDTPAARTWAAENLKGKVPAKFHDVGFKPKATPKAKPTTPPADAAKPGQVVRQTGPAKDPRLPAHGHENRVTREWRGMKIDLVHHEDGTFETLTDGKSHGRHKSLTKATDAALTPHMKHTPNGYEFFRLGKKQ